MGFLVSINPEENWNTWEAETYLNDWWELVVCSIGCYCSGPGRPD